MKKVFLLVMMLLSGWSALEAEADFGKWIQVKEGENRIGLLEMDREHPIDESIYLYVKFALEHFKKEKVDFVLLKLDTPGGEVFSALKIAQLLIKMDSEEHIPVVAFIDNWALSAGAMLAYSCRFIGITELANMGAAEPVFASADGSLQTASEKVISALRSEISNLARVYGRNPLIAEAMVDKAMIIVQREGEIIQLSGEDQIQSTDHVISHKGQLLALNAEELMRYRLADFEAASFFQVPFFSAIPEKQLIPYTDWKIDFFAFLSHPAISSLLLMGLVLGIYLEATHPGFGVPGVFAISCLALILLSSFSVQAINWLEVIFLALGLLFLCLELFVIPGFGIVGIVGIILTLGGLFALMVPSLEGMQWSFTEWSLGLDVVLYHLAWLSGAILASLILIGFLMRYLPKRKFILNRFVLEDDQEGHIPYVLDKTFIGKKAVALSDLKPSGHIEVDGEKFQAVSESKYIYKGALVIVIDAKGAYYVVKELSDADHISRH